jgi:hypothetical protein
VAARQGEHPAAFDFACQGKARLLAAAMRMRQIDLPPAQRDRLEAVRAEIREQWRALDVVTASDRVTVLERLAVLRRELSGLIEVGEGQSQPGDALALAEPLVADGGALVVPVATRGGRQVTGGDGRPGAACDRPPSAQRRAA